MDLSDLLNRPIAYHRCFADLGGVTGAVMLSQAVYWSRRTQDQDGWFYKSLEDWEEETGLTRREQETARANLKGILEVERRGLPAKLYFRINWEGLKKSLFDHSMAESAKLDCTNPPNKNGGNVQTCLSESAKLEIQAKQAPEPQNEDLITRHRLQTEITTKTTNKTTTTDVDVEDFGEGKSEKEEGYTLLRKIGINQGVARALAQVHPVDRIKAAVDLAHQKDRENFPGFIVTALQEGWTTAQSKGRSTNIDDLIARAEAKERGASHG